jgi:hypothetical protein
MILWGFMGGFLTGLGLTQHDWKGWVLPALGMADLTYGLLVRWDLRRKERVQ